MPIICPPRVIVFSVIFIGSCILVGSCNGANTNSGKQLSSINVKARSSTGAEAVVIKSLDDPSNPYKNAYREWDQWVYANLVPAPKAWKEGEYPENWDSLSAEVDENGYVIPMLETVRLREESIKSGEFQARSSSPYYVYGEGTLPEEVYSTFIKEANKIRAKYTPEIPDWLATDSPVRAMLFPNGDVITLSKVGDEVDCCSGGKQTWYRYNHDGQLTGQSDVCWWKIYYSEKHGKKAWPDGEFENRMDGYILFREPVSGQVMSVWDYDGTELPSKVPPPVRDPHPFMYLNRYFITAFHQLQHDL